MNTRFRIIFGLIPVLVEEDDSWMIAAEGRMKAAVLSKIARDLAVLYLFAWKATGHEGEPTIVYRRPEDTLLGQLLFCHHPRRM